MTFHAKLGLAIVTKFTKLQKIYAAGIQKFLMSILFLCPFTTEPYYNCNFYFFLPFSSKYCNIV